MAKYKLTLTADLTASVGATGFFNPFAKDGKNRTWLTQDSNGTWQPAHSNDYDKSDSDKWGPTLAYSKKNGATDTVAFQIYFSGLPTGFDLSTLSVNVYVVFGRMGRTNAANTVASPLLMSGTTNAQCVTVANNASNGGLTLGDGVSLCTADLSPGINQTIVTGTPTLKFEFSIAVTVSGTVSGTQINYQYGYDPELDLDVGG